MAKRTNPQNVIDSYKRRQRMTPIIVGGLAALLVIAGVVILVLALQNGPLAPVPTATPTVPPATVTSVPTATPVPATATGTATITPTATATITNTPNGPFEYTVLEKDNCYDLAVIKYHVDLNALLALNNFPAGQCPITPGQKIMIPAPGQTAPTATPVDVSKLASGTLLDYIIQPGDTLRGIALQYNSTQAAILALPQNKLTDPNKLIAGAKIVIPVNIATQVPTTTDTPTPKPGTPSVTPKPATATVTPTK